MKIGIITLSASDNCGSLLQSYALKKLLEKYGDAEVINFSSAKSHNVYDVFPGGFFHNKNYLKIRNRRFKDLLKEKYYYASFRKNQIKIRGKELFADELDSISAKYDITVTGSDQVWNVTMGDFDESFFLPWTNAKKVAYAPSLGGHDIMESDKEYISYLKQFYAISVREDRGVKCLNNLGFSSVEKVLDPTLVIDTYEFKKLIGKPLVKGDYYFYYSWAYNSEKLLKIVFNEAEKNSMPVYVIDARKWMDKYPSTWGCTLSKKQGPLAFLNLMYYAKKCFVESFHGMIFAYIFKKDFWLMDVHSEYESVDTRLRDLVELLDVKDRIILGGNDSLSINQDAPLVYKHNMQLELYKKKSLDFLDRVFG